jgi:hypothetical protein
VGETMAGAAIEHQTPGNNSKHDIPFGRHQQNPEMGIYIRLKPGFTVSKWIEDKKQELLDEGKTFSEAVLGAAKNMPLNVLC